MSLRSATINMCAVKVANNKSIQMRHDRTVLYIESQYIIEFQGLKLNLVLV